MATGEEVKESKGGGGGGGNPIALVAMGGDTFSVDRGVIALSQLVRAMLANDGACLAGCSVRVWALWPTHTGGMPGRLQFAVTLAKIFGQVAQRPTRQR
jgi:hypothetical protein